MKKKAPFGLIILMLVALLLVTGASSISCCNCSGWNVTVTWTGSSPGTAPAACGGPPVDILWINSGTPVVVNASLTCSLGCQPSYNTWSVTTSAGVPVASGNGPSASFTPTSPGSFMVVFNASCFNKISSTKCTCRIPINIKEIKPPPCNCSNWNVTVTWTGSSPGTAPAACGDTVVDIPWINSGTPVVVNASLTCSLGCQPSNYTWSVTLGNTQVASGNGPSASFTPTSPGSFMVVFNASCGGTQCTCRIPINIKEIKPPPCCFALFNFNITDMAVASDGNIIYVIANGAIYRSTDGGCIFAPCLTAGFTAPAVNIAVAPDNPLVVAVSDSSANEVVWLSTTGCGIWTSLGSPCVGGDTLTDLAVSPAVAGALFGRYYFATVADNAANVTTKGDVKMIGASSSWASVCTGVAGSHDYMAIQLSPNFVGDRCISVVGVPASAAIVTGVDYQIINVNPQACGVVQTVQVVPSSLNTTTDFQLPPAGASIIYADIALPFDFDCTSPAPMAFVSIASNTVQSTDDVYRIDCPNAIDLNVQGSGTFTSIRSIDFAGTCASGKLIAGAHLTTMVWHSTDACGAHTWQPATTPPTGVSDAVVGIHPGNINRCYAGTSGPGSCFTVSTDNAHTFCRP